MGLLEQAHRDSGVDLNEHPLTALGTIDFFFPPLTLQARICSYEIDLSTVIPINSIPIHLRTQLQPEHLQGSPRVRYSCLPVAHWQVRSKIN